MQRIALAISVSILVFAFVSGCSQGPLRATESSTSAPMIELDHVYVAPSLSASEDDVVQALRESGFIVDDNRNVFPDGVVGRYIRFDNAYLELLWLEPDATPIEQLERAFEWETTGASPFGVGLRRVPEAPEELPFPSRSYVAEWMEPGTEMRILNDEDELLAPALFVVPRYMEGFDAAEAAEWRAKDPKKAAKYLDHSLGVKMVTAVRIVTQPEGFPQATEALNGTYVEIVRGDEALMEIEFDNGAQGERKDYRPLVPLVISY
ncbi:MAG: hypothetical protein HWE27_11835 [Gammaproteobacteria bacterium]|nr:hypothetical protein [Gammaproteobacteria bacterium]